jgi:hypothetical protein
VKLALKPGQTKQDENDHDQSVKDAFHDNGSQGCCEGDGKLFSQMIGPYEFTGSGGEDVISQITDADGWKKLERLERMLAFQQHRPAQGTEQHADKVKEDTRQQPEKVNGFYRDPQCVKVQPFDRHIQKDRTDDDPEPKYPSFHFVDSIMKPIPVSWNQKPEWVHSGFRHGLHKEQLSRAFFSAGFLLFDRFLGFRCFGRFFGCRIAGGGGCSGAGTMIGGIKTRSFIDHTDGSSDHFMECFLAAFGTNLQRFIRKSLVFFKLCSTIVAVININWHSNYLKHCIIVISRRWCKFLSISYPLEQAQVKRGFSSLSSRGLDTIIREK